jgi:hypothetical protein
VYHDLCEALLRAQKSLPITSDSTFHSIYLEWPVEVPLEFTHSDAVTNYLTLLLIAVGTSNWSKSYDVIAGSRN